MRDFFDGIVTVGGGIADGAGVAGAVAAGADLVYMGTRFLATTESLAAEAYKQMVVEHGPDDLVVSAGVTGAAASWLRPSLLAHGLDPDHLVHEGCRSYDAAQARPRGGRSCGRPARDCSSIRAVQPVAEIVDELEARVSRGRSTDSTAPSLSRCPLSGAVGTSLGWRVSAGTS